MTSIKELLKHYYLRTWRKYIANKGNVHLGADTSSLKRIPFSSDQVYMRRTISDFGRVSEYLSNTYFRNSYLHNALKKSEPTAMIDVGANIGLSALSLTKEFTTIEEVIGIEAELQNFHILKKNFQLWSKKIGNTQFHPMHAVATHNSKVTFTQINSLAELNGRGTASGTFRFAESKKESDEAQVLASISMSEIFNKLQNKENVIVKIDIEGGEEQLMASNTNWLKDCSLMAIEIHDRCHPAMYNSSTNVISALSKANFAIVPSKDILICYNRSKLKI